MTTERAELKRGSKTDRIGSRCPDILDMASGIPYCITINPNDQSQFFNKPDRFQEVSLSVKSILKSYGGAVYKLHPEISKTGRIHFHGTITINDLPYFYLFCLNNILTTWHVVIESMVQFAPEKLKKYTSWDGDEVDEVGHKTSYCWKQFPLLQKYMYGLTYYHEGVMDILIDIPRVDNTLKPIKRTIVKKGFFEN